VINPLLSLRDILSRVTGEEKESSPLPLAGEGLGERVFKGTLSCHFVTSSPVNGRGKIMIIFNIIERVFQG